jgi:PB1 domain/Zinc finger, ZZ type
MSCRQINDTVQDTTVDSHTQRGILRDHARFKPEEIHFFNFSLKISLSQSMRKKSGSLANSKKKSLFKSTISTMNDNNTILIKVSYGNELRRVKMQRVQAGERVVLRLAVLRRRVNKLFPDINGAVRLTYEDDEGDRVTIATDDDLAEALSFRKQDNLLRIQVHAANNSSPASSSSSEATEKKTENTARRGPLVRSLLDESTLKSPVLARVVNRVHAALSNDSVESVKQMLPAPLKAGFDKMPWLRAIVEGVDEHRNLARATFGALQRARSDPDARLPEVFEQRKELLTACEWLEENREHVRERVASASEATAHLESMGFKAPLLNALVLLKCEGNVSAAVDMLVHLRELHEQVKQGKQAAQMAKRAAKRAAQMEKRVAQQAKQQEKRAAMLAKRAAQQAKQQEKRATAQQAKQQEKRAADAETDVDAEADAETTTPAVMPSSIICDGCERRLSTDETRFKCAECADYDLCDTCEANRAGAGHDMAHIFLKLTPEARAAREPFTISLECLHGGNAPVPPPMHFRPHPFHHHHRRHHFGRRHFFGPPPPAEHVDEEEQQQQQQKDDDDGDETVGIEVDTGADEQPDNDNVDQEAVDLLSAMSMTADMARGLLAAYNGDIQAAVTTWEAMNN